MKDSIMISKNVLIKIVQEIIVENKDLFIDKSYLWLKNDKSIIVNEESDQSISISIDINVKYGKNIKKMIETLQKEIKEMIKHITDYEVKTVNINIIGIE